MRGKKSEARGQKPGSEISRKSLGTRNSEIEFARVVLTVVLMLVSFSCRTSPTGPHISSNVQLSTDYVACTEVWLKIAISNQLLTISRSPEMEIQF